MAEFPTPFPHPVVQAPMAGGASGPALAAAVMEAGGLGFLAAGYRTAASMRREIEELRSLTGRPFGVNLFMPPVVAADRGAVDVYRDQLASEAAWYRTALGEPRPGPDQGAGGGPGLGVRTGSGSGARAGSGDDDGYPEKLAALLDSPVPVVSFTFGCPRERDLRALRRAGSTTVVTVTSVPEALAAEGAGADAVCVQGIEAGGHQGTFRDSPELDGSGIGLLALVRLVREAVALPVVAAGGLMHGAQIAGALAAGADAVQLGTAFLVCPESGAHPLHKAALTDPVFSRTELTRAFTGRPARALVNRFVREHGPYAPSAYPQVHRLTAPLRRAAAGAGDPQAMALWAGQGHRLARELPAAELVGRLLDEIRDAQKAQI